MKYLKILLLLVLPIASYGQGYISTDYLSSSNFKDDNGNKYGSGSLMILSGRYTLPLSTKKNHAGQITAWAATLNCRYGIFDNEAGAKELNPDKILNGSINISHIRPITEKWSVLASLGCGIYAAPNDVTLKSILANGAVVFVYKLRDNLSIGVGAGLTNSYGIPMILPMGYLNWQSSGKYEIKVDMSSGLNVSASTWLTKKNQIRIYGYRNRRYVLCYGYKREIKNIFYHDDEILCQPFVSYFQTSQRLFRNRWKLVAFNQNF